MAFGERARIKRLRKLAFERQNGLCYWCHEPMIVKTNENASEVWDHPRVCTADHVEWLATGGQSTPDNIVAACRDCNNRRHPPARTVDWMWLKRLQSWSKSRSEPDAYDFFAIPVDKPPA